MASITGIPNEIIAHILAYLETPDRKQARQVSESWKALIDEVVGMSVNLGTPNEYTGPDPLGPWEDVEVIDEVGFRECLIGTLDDINGPPFKYPCVVRSLSFEGPVTPFSFLTLVTPLPALQNLSLHYSALESIRLTPDMITTRLLKSLKISSHCITAGSQGRAGAVRFTKNLLILLNSIRSRQLEHCILDLPFLPEFEADVTAAILKLAGCHHHTLKVVQIYFGTVFDPPLDINLRMRNRVTPNQWDAVNFGLKRGTKLRRICYAGPKTLKQNPVWTKYFGNQQMLQELFYMNDNCKIDYGLNTISLNANTLTKLLFHVNAVDEAQKVTELDCSVLTPCLCLTHLLIRGRPAIRRILPNDLNFHGVTHQVTYPKLLNVKLLPKNVSLVSFRDIHITTSEVEALIVASDFPKLARLRLVETGCYGGTGISSEQLLNIYKTGRFKEIEFIKSFNRFVFKSFSCLNFSDQLLINFVMRNWTLHLCWNEDERSYVEKRGGMFRYRTPDHHLRANDVCDVVFE